MAGDDPTETICCALDDGQYHEIYNELSDLKGLLELTIPEDAADIGMIVGQRLAREKVKAAQELMEKAWDRTHEARHG